MESNFRNRKDLFTLVSLKLGLFEIGFVATVLLLLFGILNYFNILPVSSVFPQLSWLPRREVPNGTSPSNFTPATRYDTTKAKKLLTDYVKSTLQPNLLPSGFKIASVAQLQQNPNTFVYSATNHGLNVSAYFRYNKNGSSSNSFSISATFKSEKPISPTASMINSLLPAYFINPYLNPECRGDTNFIFCENFQSASGHKKGYGIQVINKASGTDITFFTCQIPKESTDYANARSCISY